MCDEWIYGNWQKQKSLKIYNLMMTTDVVGDGIHALYQIDEHHNGKVCKQTQIKFILSSVKMINVK